MQSVYRTVLGIPNKQGPKPQEGRVFHKNCRASLVSSPSGSVRLWSSRVQQMSCVHYSIIYVYLKSNFDLELELRPFPEDRVELI